ncbi:hypothetical protein BH11PSE3_BH11PSE3_48940 [soil metagenome]
MTSWLLEHVGLAKPYRFERTLTAFFALMLILAPGTAAFSFGLVYRLDEGTPRTWYFLYLGAMLGLALLCTRWPRIATVLLSVVALDLGLGVGSEILYRDGRSVGTLMPANIIPEASRRWHPLLQEVVQANASRSLHDGKIHYNSLGLRGAEGSPEELHGKIVVALFGGSTTEDVAVAENKSWGERLEQILGTDRFAVINHGSTLYSTVEIILKTAFYESAFGTKPDCAIYYIGGIDVDNSHVENLDPGYADYHTPMLVDALPARRLKGATESVSPTLRYLARLVVLAFDTPRPPRFPAGGGSGRDAKLEAIYARNVGTISAINRERHIRTIWIGELTRPDGPSVGATEFETWAPFVSEDESWGLLSYLNRVLKREAAVLGDIYVEVRMSEVDASDFADAEHFTIKGSLRFATKLAPTIAEACRKRE